jgi:membrane protein implicated in regulation of membrane protease activity
MATLFANPWYWIIAGAVLAGLEIVVPGVLLLWIGLGAVLVGLLLAAIPDLPLAWQLLVFAGAMIASISSGFFLQRHGRSAQAASPLNRELEGLVGRQLLAAVDFSVGQGRVRVGDTTYPAIGEDSIAAGTSVRVVAIDAGRLRVIAEPPSPG